MDMTSEREAKILQSAVDTYGAVAQYLLQEEKEMRFSYCGKNYKLCVVEVNEKEYVDSLSGKALKILETKYFGDVIAGEDELIIAQALNLLSKYEAGMQEVSNG